MNCPGAPQPAAMSLEFLKRDATREPRGAAAQHANRPAAGKVERVIVGPMAPPQSRAALVLLTFSTAALQEEQLLGLAARAHRSVPG